MGPKKGYAGDLVIAFGILLLLVAYWHTQGISIPHLVPPIYDVQ